MTNEQGCGHTSLFVDDFRGPQAIKPCLWCRIHSLEEENERLRHGLDTVLRWSEPNSRIREIAEEHLRGRTHEPTAELRQYDPDRQCPKCYCHWDRVSIGSGGYVEAACKCGFKWELGVLATRAPLPEKSAADQGRPVRPHRSGGGMPAIPTREPPISPICQFCGNELREPGTTLCPVPDTHSK